MWFSLFAVVLILAITFYQGLHGAFSAVIMCILTVLSASLAFALYEDLYFAFLVDYQPDHGRAIALMAIFILTLLMLRTVVDIMITGNLQFPVYVDRALGGLFGFVTAVIIIGMLTIGFQILPFYSSIMSFERYSIQNTGDDDAEDINGVETDLTSLDWSKIERKRNDVWFNPDGLTVRLISHLSDNALAGRNRFTTTYPDYLGQIHAVREGMTSSSRHVVGAKMMEVGNFWYTESDLRLRAYEKGSQGKTRISLNKKAAKAPPGTKRLVLRAGLKPKAVEEKEKLFLFSVGQVRLVGRLGEEAQTRSYFLRGISDEMHPDQLILLYDGEVLKRKMQQGPTTWFDFVFEVPEDGFEPLFVEYKLNTRAPILLRDPLDRQSADEPIKYGSPDGQGTPSDPGAAPQGSNPPNTQSDADSPKGRVHGLNVASEPPSYDDNLPWSLTEYSVSGPPPEGGQALRSGQIMVTLDSNWAPPTGTKRAIAKFEVPSGHSLLQLRAAKLRPGSWLGGILGGAKDRLKNLYIEDSGGRPYRPVGAYAMANVSGRNVFELIYLDEFAITAERTLPDFRNIKSRDLKGQYAYVLLFHVPSGRTAARFQTGNKSLDLRKYNLVAP